MKCSSASASLPAWSLAFVAKNLHCNGHGVPPRSGPTAVGRAWSFVALLCVREFQSRRGSRSGSTASAATCSRQRARDLWARRDSPDRDIERVARPAPVPSTRTSRAEALAPRPQGHSERRRRPGVSVRSSGQTVSPILARGVPIFLDQVLPNPLDAQTGVELLADGQAIRRSREPRPRRRAGERFGRVCVRAGERFGRI